MNRVGAQTTLWAFSAVLSALVLAPLARGGDLLYRDAVSTPRSHVTDVALGLGDAPARAVPQDWAVALASSVVDGSAVVIGLTFLALVLAGVGLGRLAGRMIPAARTSGMLAAAAIAIWNPFVAERLLQGQWSLLLGYGAMGWVVLSAYDIRRTGASRAGARLAAWTGLAAFTPTGWLYAAVVVIVVFATRTRALRRLAALAVLVVTSLPWTVAAALSSAPVTSDSGAVAAFAARAETGLGTLGTLAGLGGIWNADAVPSSRTGPWTVVATACLLGVVAAGSALLLRRRARSPLIGPLAVLAGITLVLVALAATPPGQAVLRLLIETVPGAGLLRDTSKFVALLVPFYAIAAAAAVQTLGRRVPRGFAATVVIALIVAPLPDLAWGVGGTVRTVSIPRDFAAVADLVPADRGDVVVLPAGSNRRYDITGGVVSLDPAGRMLRAPVLSTGELRVDGSLVDAAPDSRAARAQSVLARGGPPGELARLGVGWVLVEATGDPTQRASATLRSLPLVFDGTVLQLYRVADPTTVRASAADRTLSWAAHLAWAATILIGFAGAALIGVGRLFSWRPWRAPTSPRSAG